MSRTETLVVFACTIVITALATAHAQDSDGMARCAEIENADARLACYDEAVGHGAEKESASAPSRSQPLPLTQEVGEEQLDLKMRTEREPESFQGRVIECKQDSSKKWYFVFDNGQVWKQRANARLTNRDCDFEVTITKDGFGYKMQIEGEGSKIRVGRIR